ncbi:MAG TPA: cytochrome c peroxidase [Pyrinomonadaceae bacterium]|nr:cytochrome c peroxidase [Pyrinomonadaceae bacterium]
MSTTRRYFLSLIIGLLLIAAAFLVACNRGTYTETAGGFKPEIQPLPAQLSTYEAMPIPADNPLTPEKVALGRQLFFDERLSGDGSRSCYSCHVCEKGLTDGLAKAVGAFNKQLPRSSPTLWNIGYHHEFYWDGRSPSLEKQAMAAWTGANMGAKADEIAAKLNALQGYKAQFQQVFQSDATPDNIVKAIAAFERTIISGNTAWDRYQAGDKTAIDQSAWRGSNIFQAIKCNNCHDGVLFTDQQYHNVGIGMDQKEPDPGRFKVTNNAKDTGAFKTPTLRDIAKSAPYFHDGSTATLEEAVDIMLAGGKPNEHLDKTNLQPHKLFPDQRQDLLNFLKSLSVTDCGLTKPPLPEK